LGNAINAATAAFGGAIDCAADAYFADRAASGRVLSVLQERHHE
jgi:hypothetical protein